MEITDNNPNKIEDKDQAVYDCITTVEPESLTKSPPIYYDTLVLSGASTKGMVTLGTIQYACDNFLLKN